MLWVRLWFVALIIRFARGAWHAETRVWFGWTGPLLIAAGCWLALIRQLPALVVPLIIAGSAVMLTQAGRVERRSRQSLRNGAIWSLGWAMPIGILTRDWLGFAFGLGLCAALAALHYQQSNSPTSTAST